MKRLFKYALASLGILFLGITAALLVLRHKYPPKKVQAVVLNKLQTALHREIRLSSAHFGFRGLSLEGLEVSEEPNFKAGTLLKARTIYVLPRLSALLEHRIELSDVLLSDWECDVIHRANGTWNVQSTESPSIPSTKTNAKTAPSKTTPAEMEHALSATWDVDRVRLENGTVRYTDKAAHATYTLKNIQISTKRIKPKGSFPVDLSTDYSGQGLEGRIELHGTTDLGGLDPAKMMVQWDSLKLRHLGLAMESSGQIKNLSAPELNLKASLPKQQLDAESSSHWPQWLPLIIPIQGEVDLHKTDNKIDLRQVNIIWNSLRAEMKGRMQLKKKGFPDIHLQVKTGNFSLADMAAFLPPAHRVRPQGQGNIELLADGPANAPMLSGEASLSDVAVSYDKQSLSGLQASAKFSPEVISVQAQGIWNRGNFQISLSGRNYRTTPNIQLNGQLSELDLESLSGTSSTSPTTKGSSGNPSETPSQASSPAPFNTSGQFTIGKIVHPNFTASKSTFIWDLKNANIQSRITGSAKFNIGEGHFDDLKNVTGKNKLINVLLLPVTMLQEVGSVTHIPLLPSFDRVNFKTISGDYAFQNGVMTIHESHMDSSAAYVKATGKTDLAKQTLDMHLATKLFVKGLDGPIGFKVGGTFEHPTYTPDVASILKQPAVNQVIQQGTKLLQNLFR